MKLLIVELDYHPEVLQGIFKHLDSEKIEVYVATTPKIFSQADISVPKDHLFLKATNQSTTLFLNEVAQCTAFELILFNTAQSRFHKLEKVAFKAPIVVLVHNVNAYFNRWKIRPAFTPFFLWKDFSFLIRVVLFQFDWYYRAKFLSRVDRFLFPSYFMLNAAISEKEEWLEKFISTPISWVSTKTEKTESVSSSPYFRITIVGSIDRRRRDYQQILSLINFLKKETTKQVLVCFAGKPFGSFGKKVIKSAKELEGENVKVESFDGFIPPKELAHILRNTQLLIAPIIQKTRHHIWGEEYGKTKITGAIGNAVEYGINILIPRFYPLESEYAKFMIPYRDSKDLNQQTLDFLNQDQRTEESPRIDKSRIEDQLIELLIDLKTKLIS